MCPYYMAMGMSYEEFWYASPCLIKTYLKAHELKVEQRNQELFLQGLYNYKAFQAVIEEFSYGLSGKKGKKPEGYLEYPIPITEHEKEMEKQRRILHTMEIVAKGQK